MSKSGLKVATVDRLWAMEDGTMIRVGDMSENHAKNCLRVLMRRVDEYNKAVVREGQEEFDQDWRDMYYDSDDNWGDR